MGIFKRWLTNYIDKRIDERLRSPMFDIEVKAFKTNATEKTRDELNGQYLLDLQSGGKVR